MLIAAAAVLIGFIILIWSADLFVDGAAAMADNMGMSPIIIGLTIVSLGTSAPEVVVALIASLADAGDLAIGNAIGSNIANLGLVLGITLLVSPLFVHKSCMHREMPTLLVVTLAVGLLIIDREASRLDGVLMMGALVIILWQLVGSQSHDLDAIEEISEESLPHMRPLRAWLTFLTGLLLLIGSSRLLVWGASEIATQLGVSKLVIGLTIVAVGTSLPELAATVASAVRGHTEIALGNIIGSNLFNLLGVMSIPGIIQPQIMALEVLQRDYLAMLLFTVALTAAMIIGRQRAMASADNSYMGRTVGVLFVSMYAMYYYWLYLTI
jgi:cation:H+ antiporter